MSKYFFITIAAAMTIATSAGAADYSEIRDGYSTDAFSDANERWRRITSNRYDVCSRYGDKSNTRLNVLVDRYLAIGEALDANDEAATMAATKKLARAVNINGRFAECWNTIARREGVSAEFRDMLNEM